MRAAVDRVDVVGEAEHRLGVAVVVLQRNFHRDAVALGFHVDGLVMQHLLAAVQMLDELRDAAGVLEVLRACASPVFAIGGALVGERDLQALVQEGEFAQPLRQRVVVEFGNGEDALVRQEVDLGAALLAGARSASASSRQRPCA